MPSFVPQSNDQLCAWRERQRRLLTCRTSGDAATVLLRDAANTLAALSSAGRIFDDTDVWPHREVFPLPLVLAKRVEVLDASVFGARALLQRGQLRAVGQRQGARFYVSSVLPPTKKSWNECTQLLFWFAILALSD